MNSLRSVRAPRAGYVLHCVALYVAIRRVSSILWNKIRDRRWKYGALSPITRSTVVSEKDPTGDRLPGSTFSLCMPLIRNALQKSTLNQCAALLQFRARPGIASADTGGLRSLDH